MMSVFERFEHDRVRAHFARIAGENLVSPDEKATGIGVFVSVGFLEAYGFGVPVGGSGALTAARWPASRITAGRCSPTATCGACRLHRAAPPAWSRATAEATQFSPAACITVHAALAAPLRFCAGEQVRAVMIELLPDSYEAIRRSFDDLRYGQLCSHPLVGLGSLTMFDPSRVPPGRAIAHLWDYVPYHRADGRDWDEAKGAYAQRLLEHAGRFIDNLGPGDLIAWHCDSPVDMERTSPSFMHGDLRGIAPTFWQSGAHRPTPDLGQYVVPGVERFYLVGPFQHPGGGVFGAGRATAMKVFEDLKLDFERLCSA